MIILISNFSPTKKSKVRGYQQKTEQKSLTINAGKYVQDFMIALSFNNGERKLVDFLPLFQKYVKGDNLKYFAPQNFKKFILNMETFIGAKMKM